MLIGYNDIRDLFEKARVSGVLAHAYCLVGPHGVGKRTFAREIAATLLATTPERLALSPNFHEIARREDEKTGKLKKEISVKDARELKALLSKGRWGGEYQVAIIDDAELLNDEASNALLKLLEEPPSGSILFLLAINDMAILPTIRSRVEMLYMQPLSSEALGRELGTLGFNQTAIEAVLPFAAGRIGFAVTLLSDQSKREWCEAEITRLHSMIGQPLYTKLALAEDMFSESEDHMRGREIVADILELWIGWWKCELEAHIHGTLARTGSDFTAQRITTIIDSIVWTRGMLAKNIHPRLLIEQLLLQF